MKVLLLSRYDRLGSSSRLRALGYLPALAAAGIEVEPHPFFDNDYLRKRYSNTRIDTASVISYYRRRLNCLYRCRDFDLTWIEVEALPWLPYSLERRLLSRRRYVLDCDDAWFHRYRTCANPILRQLLADKVDRMMAGAELVIAGNDYIADHARRAGAKAVRVLPTVVELERYPYRRPANNEACVIGWIGTPPNTRYLRSIEDALSTACQDGTAQLRVIGAKNLRIDGIPVDCRSWDETTEAEELSRIDIGIMPLSEGLWEQGKCGYKIIQYMAAGRPAIASPIGENRKILKHGETGYLAGSQEDWTAALLRLRDDPALRERFGAAGRRRVETHYTTEVTAPRLIEMLRQAAGVA